MKKKLFVRNEEQWKPICEKTYYLEQTLSVTNVPNGLILPAKESEKKGAYLGGVTKSNGEFVAGFNRNTLEANKWYGISSAYYVEDNQVEKFPDTVIFGGVLVGQFGHFILEGFSRFWYILKHPELNYKIVFITILEKKQWFYSFFKIMGISLDRIVFLDEITQFKEVIVPEESIHSWNCYTKEFLLPIHCLRDSVEVGRKEKIYLTRNQYDESGALCINEGYFEQFYKEKGFSIVAPEQLSIEEQIGLLAGAKEVVCTLGSISHLLLFCQEKTKVTVLTRVDDDTLIPQALIHEACKLDWYIVDVSMNFLFATRVYGVNLLGITNCFKEYVFAYYDQVLEEETDTAIYYEYIKKWCEFYACPDNFNKVYYQDFIKLFCRINNFFSDNKVSEEDYRKKTDIKKLEKKIQEQEKQIEFLQNNMRGNVLGVSVHRQNEGWTLRVYQSGICGLPDSQRQIEAIRLIGKGSYDCLKYRVYLDGMWMNFVEQGEIAGTVGESKAIYGICIQTKKRSIYYRVHTFDHKWSKWICSLNPDELLVDKKIDAIEFKIEKSFVEKIRNMILN